MLTFEEKLKITTDYFPNIDLFKAAELLRAGAYGIAYRNYTCNTLSDISFPKEGPSTEGGRQHCHLHGPEQCARCQKIEYEVVACGPMTVEFKDDDGDVFDTEELDGEYVTLEPRHNTWDTFRTLNIRKEKFLDNFKKKCMSTAHMAQGLTEDTVVIFEPASFYGTVYDTAANALYVAWTRGSKKRTFVPTQSPVRSKLVRMVLWTFAMSRSLTWTRYARF